VERGFPRGNTAQSKGASRAASTLESDSDKITSAPNQPAFLNGAKIIERHIEIWRKYIDAIELDPSPGTGEVADFACKNAALRAKEQQHATGCRHSVG
jgi:hypothetical protein